MRCMDAKLLVGNFKSTPSRLYKRFEAKKLVGNLTSARLCDKFGAKKGVRNSASKLKPAGPYSNYLCVLLFFLAGMIKIKLLIFTIPVRIVRLDD